MKNKSKRSPVDECDHNECDHVCMMKNKPKHTSGPWSVKDLDTIYDTRGIKLAYVSDSLYKTGPHGGVYNSADYKDERNANAQLISAAPEMLEALEQTLSCIDNWTHDPVVGPIIEQAKNAITKAKGGAK
jgi:hypothetical protein